MAKWHIAITDYVDPRAVACGRRDMDNTRIPFERALEKLNSPLTRGAVCKNCIGVLNIQPTNHSPRGEATNDDRV